MVVSHLRRYRPSTPRHSFFPSQPPKQHQNRISTSNMELFYVEPVPRALKLKIAPLKGDQQSCPPVMNGGRQMRRIVSRFTSLHPHLTNRHSHNLIRNNLRRLGSPSLRQSPCLHRTQNNHPKRRHVPHLSPSPPL